MDYSLDRKIRWDETRFDSANRKSLQIRLYTRIREAINIYTQLDGIWSIKIMKHPVLLFTDGIPYQLNIRVQPIRKRIVYLAPCHQREQKTGSPYIRLLSRVPELIIEQIGGANDCCGMGGSLDFKKWFYDASVSFGSSTAAKIRESAPDTVFTDCLSCRLQFKLLLPYSVVHTLEILPPFLC